MNKKIFSLIFPTSIAMVGLAIGATTISLVNNNSIKQEIAIINKNKLDNLCNELNIHTNKLTIKEFNNLFSNENKKENIEKVSNFFGINSNAISEINASGEPKDAFITINANDNYEFNISNSKNTNISSQNVNWELSNDNKSIVFFHVEFIQTFSLTKDILNNFGSNINNSMTFEQFKNLFNNKNDYLKYVAKSLGIDPSLNAITSVDVQGDNNNSIIIINLDNNYQFDGDLLGQTINHGNFEYVVNKNKIQYTGIVFSNLPSLLSFASNIDLNNSFKTLTSESSFTTDDFNDGIQSITTKITKSSIFNVNITSFNKDYFNVALPNSLNNVFDTTGLNLNNAKIQWNIKENDSNKFLILETINGTQYIQNNERLEWSTNSAIVLTASIVDSINNMKIANDLNVTFNFNYGAEINIDDPNLSNVFSLDSLDNNYQQFTKIEFANKYIKPNDPNLIDLKFKRSTLAENNISVNLTNLCDFIKTNLNNFFGKEVVDTLDWVPAAVSFWGDESSEKPDFQNWTGNSGIKQTQISSQSQIGLDWGLSVTFTDPSIQSVEFYFYIFIDFID